MKTEPIAAFGAVAFLVTADPGDFVEVPLNKDGLYPNGYYYFISGESYPVVIETGEVLGKRSRGWLNTEKNAQFGTSGAGGVAAVGSGTIRMEFSMQTSWICIPNNVNSASTITSLSSAEYLAGTSVSFLQGDDIFLADGQITIGAKVFTAPAQIRVRSSSVTGIADVDSLTLKFVK